MELFYFKTTELLLLLSKLIQIKINIFFLLMPFHEFFLRNPEREKYKNLSVICFATFNVTYLKRKLISKYLKLDNSERHIFFISTDNNKKEIFHFINR